MSYLIIESNSPWSTRMNTLISEDDIGVNLSRWNSGEITTLFITGISGSGKTTLANKYAKDFRCTKVHMDTFRNMGNMNLYTIKQWCPLIAQYIEEGRIEKDFINRVLSGKIVLNNTEKIKTLNKAVNDFIDYCVAKKERKVIEGVDIPNYIISRELYDYPVIFKGTSKLTSLFRRIKRDWSRYKSSEESLLQQLLQDKVIYDIWETEQNHLRQNMLLDGNEMTTLKESVGTYQDSLSIYNSLTPQEKKWCSPSGRFIDSPAIISRQIIYNNNQPAAFGEIYKYNGKSKNVGFIVLAVHPKFRGKGYAKQVIDRCINEIKSKGYNKLVYRVDNDNIGSIKLARSYGFNFIRKTKTQTIFDLHI